MYLNKKYQRRKKNKYWYFIKILNLFDYYDKYIWHENRSLCKSLCKKK